MGRLGQRKQLITPLFDEVDADLRSLLWQRHNGFAATKLGNELQFAHRIVMARVLGRALSPTDRVRTNGDKMDCRRGHLTLIL